MRAHLRRAPQQQGKYLIADENLHKLQACHVAVQRHIGLVELICVLWARQKAQGKTERRPKAALKLNQTGLRGDAVCLTLGLSQVNRSQKRCAQDVDC